jgi:LEA14-like dessication related protein
MIKKYWPYLLGGGLLIYYFTKLKKASASIKVNLIDLKLSRGTGLNLPTLTMKFEIINPTNTTVNVLGVVGDVYLNDQFIATVSNLDKIQIPGNDKIDYSIDVKASALDAIPAIINLIKTKGTGQGLRVKANLNVNVDDILFPVDIDKKVI